MRNAFTGYTYQRQVALLLLSVMDVERNIRKIEIEAKTKDNFEDLIVSTPSNFFQIQIKDIEPITINDLKVNGNVIFIKGKSHKLSSNPNIIFFKEIDIETNEKFLFFPSFRLNENISIVSLSRIQIDETLETLYQNDLSRLNEIEFFLNRINDQRIWEIPIESLPQLKVFLTELQEESISITHKLTEFENLLLIEGKPGIGKSHFVNTLSKEHENSVVYRFWIGNQDRDRDDRLRYKNFLRDLNTKLFLDQKIRTVEDLFKKLSSKNSTFIIDGLDHVENYNKKEFGLFVNFIEQAKEHCKIIVLSRPLTTQLNWKRFVLENWNFTQTKKFLNVSYHLSDYSMVEEIYRISKGYPIIVKYLAEHFKIHKAVPSIESVESIDSYYSDIIADEKGKHSLSVFLSCNSFILKSELELFLGDEKVYVEEFIREHPYLFDIKLNRISLFHDSLNTFLRNKVAYQTKAEKVSAIVTDSLLRRERRFLSRFLFFQLSHDQRKKIITKYSSIKSFEKILNENIDYESLISFYNQLRQALIDQTPKLLNSNQYYDLSLIFNVLTREHISTINSFYYTFVQTLISNGITEEDITSSDYLFGMFFYVKTKNATLLLNRTDNDFYDVANFHKKLKYDVNSEDRYFQKHKRKIDKERIVELLKDGLRLRENITYIIENIFIHNLSIKGYQPLKLAFEDYRSGNKYKAVEQLRQFLSKFNVSDYYPEWILRDSFNNLVTYGYNIDNEHNEHNEYRSISLKDFITKNGHLGSYDLRDKVHHYIRLALYENRPIDIRSISLFWTKYYNRRDDSLQSLPLALQILNEEKLITLKESINLICHVQNISEKGYRYLLAEFICLFPPSLIIPFLESNFQTKDLTVEWFKLPSKYINRFSMSTFNIQMGRLFRYHSHHSVPFEEVENVLNSNKFEKAESSLTFHRLKITYKSEESRRVSKFKNSNLILEELKDPDYVKERSNTSQKRFEKGILSINDMKFIKKKNLLPSDIAKCSDDWYTSFSDVNIFQHFTHEQMLASLKLIMYNSMTSKAKGTQHFFSLSYHPGNLLFLIKKYSDEKEFEIAVDSFKRFLHLSMFRLG